ncbi:MAG: hypothetical protein OXC80_11010 [Gammaproteobacteria bacterium]|nr:hypothetical protein [Gammaproteobacteria bacterium]
MSTFSKDMEKTQTAWRQRHIATREQGTQNGVQYPWILPKNHWWESLWPGIRLDSDNSVERYIKKAKIQEHSGVHNLKSSWVLCANLYFAHRCDRRLLTRFLADHVDRRIVQIECLELEWVEEAPLDPSSLLGEPGGRRGASQTSPDVAFVVSLQNGGRGLILTEIKFTEHSFYPCSGRKKEYGNPDPERCLSAQTVFNDPGSQCHLLNWETKKRTNRQYWDHIEISQIGLHTLQKCPAAMAGYQLFRQTALAEGIAKSGRYDLVVSAVAYDERNKNLVHSMRSTGVEDFTEEWGALINGPARFTTFTHQEWVSYVRSNDTEGHWRKWLDWMNERYGY